MVRIRARVLTAETGERLRVSLQVVGRGVWKPVITPLLMPLGLPLREHGRRPAVLEGRGTRALQEAFARLPEVGTGWPSVGPAMAFDDSGRWWGEEQWLFDILIDRDPRRRIRHELVDQQVDLWLHHQELMISHREQAQPAHREAGNLITDLSALIAAEVNEPGGLSWLASPWSTVRHLVQRAGGQNEDQPPIKTDADARRFVTDVLQDSILK